MKRTTIILLLFISFSGITTSEIYSQGNTTKKQIINNIKSNLEFLASDELKGRDAGSESEKIASLFIASELKKYGVEQFGENGTYFQEFELFYKQFRNDSRITILDGEDEEIIPIGDGFVSMVDAKIDEDLFTQKLRLVFVGYGVEVPELDYSDYSKCDVEGKVALIMRGAPKDIDEKYFDDKGEFNYSGLSAKINAAKRNGASGIILLPNKGTETYWEHISRYATYPTMMFPDEKPSKNTLCPAFISVGAAKKLLKNEKYDYTVLRELEENGNIPSTFELNKRVNFGYKYIAENRVCRNVVGLIRGNDPLLNDEYVSMGAHYDHVGISEGKIYNGADDNGSGTVAVLDAARELLAKKSNKRSVIVLFYTAEEKGLLGSKYYVKNFDDIDNVLANVNVDMIGRNSVDSVFCIGADRVSDDFNNLVKEANEELANFFLDYSLSNTNLFFQSDHHPWSKKGMPVVFFFDNMRSDLHRPTDDVEKIKYEKIYKGARLIERIVEKISNREQKFALDE